MRRSDCPKDEVISDFIVGKIDEESAEAVESHIVACPDCRTVLEAVEINDTFVSSLRIELGESVFDAEPELQTAIAELRQPIDGGGDLTNASTNDWQEAPTDSNLVGQRLGQYRLLGLLGRGGMGAVYKAEHGQLEMIVAIKVLSETLAHDRQAIARFEREMRAVGKVSHPNIIKATDAGKANGTPYLAMEFVQGADLGQVLAAKKRLSIADACEAVRQAAIGLDHVHQKGMIHRDIKPSNLMVTTEGKIKVLDLGLARIQQGNAKVGLTNDFQVMGTADYMSPEQAINVASLDHRADIYSLGCTLYALLCGQPPFKHHKAPLKKLMAHEAETPRPVGELREDVSEELLAIVDQCLAKAPSDRFKHASQLANRLQAFAHDADLETLARTHQETGTSLAGRSTHYETQSIVETDRFTQPPAESDRNFSRVWLASGTLVMCLIVGLSFNVLQNRRPTNLNANGRLERAAQEQPVPVTPKEQISERDVATWAIQKGAIVNVVSKDQQHIAGKLEELPDGEFFINGVNFTKRFEPSTSDFDRLKHLERLDLIEFQDLQVTDEIVNQLVRLEALVVLRLRYDETKATGLERLERLPRLIDITLGGELVGDEEVKQITGLHQINSLTLSGKQVTNAALRDIAKMRQLTFLSMIFTQVTAEELHLLHHLDLWALHLPYTQVSDTGLEHLLGFEEMKWLGLGKTHITDDALQVLSKMPELTTLSAHETGITTAGIAHLKRFPKLKELDVGSSLIDDRAVEHFLKLQGLTRLEIGNRLSQEAIDALREGMPHCRVEGNPKIQPAP